MSTSARSCSYTTPKGITMTTIRQIIIDAYGESNIVALDDEPTAEQYDFGLRRLNTLIQSLFGNELGEPLIPVNYGTSGLANSYGIAQDQTSYITSKYVPFNSRLILNLNTASTVYLNPKPKDGERFGVIDNAGNLGTYNLTVDANGRHIETTNSVTLNTNSLNREWFYRGDLNNWVRVADLISSDPSPLPSEFDDLLVTLLAFRINPRFGAETGTNLTEVLKRARKQFRARYSQIHEVSSELGLYRLTGLYPLYWNQSDFNHGRP